MRWMLALALMVMGCGDDGGAVTDALPSTDAPTDGGTDDAPGDGSTSSSAPPTGHCRGGWCWVYPLPQGNALDAIWGTAENDVWAIGANGTTMHYDGTAWTHHDAGYSDPGRGASMHLWGSGANNVFAAHDNGVWRWNGSAWAMSTTGRAYAVGGTSATDVWAFFLSATSAKQFDGTTWVDRPLPAAGWRTVAIGGSTPGRPIVVGANGSVARWTGVAWAIAVATGPVTSAVILDDTHIVATNDAGVVFWNGAAWGGPPTAPAAPLPTGRYAAVAATSYTDVWVRGYHYNGTTWAPVPDDARAAWRATWMPAPGRVWALSSTTDVRAWTGTTWDRKVTAGEHTVLAVWGTADDDIWIVVAGTMGTETLHWDGSAWTNVPFPFEGTFVDIWGSAPDDYWIVGAKYPAMAEGSALYGIHWNGTEWREQFVGGDDSILGNGLTSVWGTARDNIYATAPSGLLRYDGNAWTFVAMATNYTHVFGTSANDVYALLGTQEYRHWNGTTWETKSLPQDAQGGWANGPMDIWFAGLGGVMQFDGSFVTAYATGGVSGIPVGTATDMYAIRSRDLWHWDGGATATPARGPAPFVDPRDGWRAPSGRVYAVAGGLLVHEP